MWPGAFALAVSVSVGLAVMAAGDAPPEESWVLPDEAIGTRMAPILLLSRPDVQSELEIEAIQADAARRAIVDLHSRAATLRGRSGAEAVASRRAIDEAAGRWVDEHLSDDQRSRLAQLDLQWEGPAALLSRPTIAASLGLSDDQRRQVAEQLARPLAPAEGPITAHRRRHRDAAAILIDDQRLRWLAMLGPPFEPGVPRQGGPEASGG